MTEMSSARIYKLVSNHSSTYEKCDCVLSKCILFDEESESGDGGEEEGEEEL